MRTGKAVKAMHMSVALVLALLTTAGCGGKSMVYSGFLDDYSTLRPSAEVEGALYWQDPDMSLADYDKFMIDPVVVHLHASKDGKSIDPAKLNKLVTDFRRITVEKLSEDYEVVNQAGPGVLRIQAAITDLDANTAVLNVHWATKLSGLGLGGASMEAKATDGESGELVAAVVDSRAGERLALDMTSGLKTWGSAQQAMEHWAERFKKRVDKAHGK
jgi:hypothetical protein